MEMRVHRSLYKRRWKEKINGLRAQYHYRTLPLKLEHINQTCPTWYTWRHMRSRLDSFEDIRTLMRWCHMRSGDDSGHNLVSYVVTVNLNVLYTLMKGWISGDEDSGLIITMHGHSKRRWNVEIFEKWSKPYHLPRSLSHSSILELCAGAWYHFLFSWSPGDEVTSNVSAIACNRFIISLVTSIPSVRVGFNTEMTVSSIDEPSPWGSLDVC